MSDVHKPETGKFSFENKRNTGLQTIEEKSISFYTGSEVVIRLEKGYFWYKGERIEDIHKVYDRFNEWLGLAEIIRKSEGEIAEETAEVK